MHNMKKKPNKANRNYKILIVLVSLINLKVIKEDNVM